MRSNSMRFFKWLLHHLGRTPVAGPALLLASRYAASIIGPLVSLLLVRYLGPEQYGLYASAVAVVTLFGVITDFGLQQAAVESASAGRHRLPLVIRTVIYLGGIYSLVAYLAVALWVVAGRYEQVVIRIALTSALAFFQTPLLSAVTVGLQVRGLYGRIALWNWASSTAKWVGTLTALVARADVFAIVLWPVMFSWFVTLIMITTEAKGLDLGLKGQAESPPLRELFQRAWRFGIAGMMHQIYHQADQAMLSLIRDPVEVGHYAVAFRMVEFLNAFPGVVFNQVLYPKYFLWFRVDRSKIQQYYQMLSKWMLATGVTAAVLVHLFARDIVILLFGPGQRPAADFLAIMAWATPARFLASSAGALLTTGGLIERKIRVQAIVALVNVSLNLALIPRYGALASAALMIGTDAVLGLIYIAVAKHALGMHVWTSTRQVVLAVTLLSACLGTALESPREFTVRLVVGCGAVVGAVVYMIAALNSWELDELRRLLGRRDAAV